METTIDIEIHLNENIKKGENKIKLRRFSFSKFFFILIALSFFVYFQLFTFFAPDTYVFVKYAYEHNLSRNLSINSITSNNFIFDLLTVIGDNLGLNRGVDFLLLIVFSSSLLFIVKYTFFLRLGKKRNVIIVLLASFYSLDLNMFRYNLSLFILMSILYNNGNNKFLKTLLSFLAHLMPLMIILAKRFYYIPLILFLVLPLSMFLGESRVFAYLENPELKFFKSLLLAIPYLVCYTGMKKSEKFNYKLMKIGESFLIVGVFLVFYSTIIATRCLETAFILCTVANLYMPFSKLKRDIIFVFSIMTFLSRTIGGINAGQNDFILEFFLK